MTEEQKKQFAGMLHMSCSHFRRGITAPEQINTARTGNRASGVMVEDKTRQRLPASNFSLGIQAGLLRLNEGQAPWGKESCIGGDRASGDQDEV
jgi:hypothetical protein